MQIIAPELGIRNRPETTLLIHPTGADQSQAITDASFGGPKPITVAGNTKIVTQDLRHPYARSAIYFPGGASCLSTPDSQDFTLGTNSFVMEGWFFFLSSANAKFLVTQVDTSSRFWCLDTTGTGQFRFYCKDSNELINFSSGFAASVNSFYFITIARSGNTWRFYVNGNLTNTVTNSASMPDFSSALELGTYDHLNYSFNGYMSDFRLSVGTDRGYTGSTIAVPTAPLTSDSYTTLLIRGDNMTQPTAFKDASPSQHTITAAANVQTVPLPPGASAMYFDGTGYLTTPASSDFSPGSGDCTIHFWACPTAFPTDYNSFFGLEDTSGYPGTFANFRADGRIRWCVRKASGGNADVFDVTSTAAVPINAPCHIAFVKSGAIYKVFLNGNVIISTTGLASMETANAPFYVGGRSSGYGFAGSLRGFTVARRALWTRNFTPPNRLA